MKKEMYEHTELEIIKFHTGDVIATSGPVYEEDELPIKQFAALQYENICQHYADGDCVYLDGGGFRRRREPRQTR